MNPDRPNTIVVDFSVLPIRPEAAKVHKFIMEELKLQLSEVKQIQFHHIRKCVFIELTSIEAACRYETEHNLTHFFWCGDKKFAIHVYVDSGITVVRVQDLPPSVDNATVHNYMQQFGTVTSITKERWKHYFPGVLNGVRVLHIRLRQPIPSYITINGFQTSCVYNGQKPTCRLCGKAAHPKQKCLETVAAPSAKTTLPTPAPLSTESTLRPSDFPPLTDDQAPSSPDTFGKIIARARRSLAEEEGTKLMDNTHYDSTDNSSSSSAGTIDDCIGSAKRRLSARKANEKKKVCSDQCSSNADPLV